MNSLSFERRARLAVVVLAVLSAIGALLAALLASAQPAQAVAAHVAAHVPAPPTYLWTLVGKTTNDPVVSYYFTACGTRPGSDIQCTAQGFELDITATSTPAVFVVYQVVLYSDRNTGFAQYPGKLPWWLTWATTAQGMVNALGQPRQVTGGFGTDITYIYYSSDGYRVYFELVARHTADLNANTPIQDIKIDRWR